MFAFQASKRIPDVTEAKQAANHAHNNKPGGNQPEFELRVHVGASAA
jgi:hypothetical protein